MPRPAGLFPLLISEAPSLPVLCRVQAHRLPASPSSSPCDALRAGPHFCVPQTARPAPCVAAPDRPPLSPPLRLGFCPRMGRSIAPLPSLPRVQRRLMRLHIERRKSSCTPPALLAPRPACTISPRCEILPSRYDHRRRRPDPIIIFVSTHGAGSRVLRFGVGENPW